MRPRSWCWAWAVLVVGLWGVGGPAQAFTLEGYFKVLALAAKKRDVWRKIFLGKDVGFDVSPWLFKDRVRPPYVPVVTSFPRSPSFGHYRNERNPAASPSTGSSYTFYDGQVSIPNARRYYTYLEGGGEGGRGGRERGSGGWWNGRAVFQGLRRNDVIGQDYFGESAGLYPGQSRHRREIRSDLLSEEEGRPYRRRRRATMSRGATTESLEFNRRFQDLTYLGYTGLPER
ncbi:uncharacterized protein LOC122263812 [Penaeus japonicus]|uniref:uncharacterized protein LOC122263812 n=1 Tax=Penaeus japonicus TaxID=27405 RepID=UPI001C70B825|nr:uncharacterized protein LOC122263812 [Penaeus japonicus]